MSGLLTNTRDAPKLPSMTTQSDTLGWVPVDSFGSRLALVRQHMGWNLKEAAEMCGIAPESWRRWERDGRSPTRYLEVVRTIAEATGADYDWLLDGRRFPPPRSASTPEYTDRDGPGKVTVRDEEDTSSLSLGEAA
jgi:transcriptional regulator with XRE-family HTH domain